MNTRPSLDQLGLGMGKKARLHRILHEHGVGNGTAIFLPYDHGLEHGPRDFAGHPESGDPRHVIRLAVEGGFNGVALQIGLAGKFYWEYAGEVPLVLKLNGKTDIPSPADPVSPVNATVEEAVRLGADAVGYTLYVGTPGQERDFAQYLRVREDAERFGMPLIVWSYPRGAAIDAKDGKDSFYAVDYAAACPGPYPARAGGPWLCSTLVLSLFHAVVVPSGLTTRVQPQRWMTTWWWKGHSSTQSFTDVLPPRALCLVWCTSHAPAGWVQPPAHWQCRSRSSTALRIPAGTVSAYPMSSGRLGPASRAPSCRRRRNDASPPGPDSRSTALPITACSSGGPGRGGAGPGLAALRGACPVRRRAGPGPPARPR